MTQARSPITTHVLDTARGCPAQGVPITLERIDAEGSATVLGKGETDDDGRLGTLMKAAERAAGVYRITFDTATYYGGLGERTFYPSVSVVFEITAPEQHHHVPLLLSPFGYSTYRGS